MAAHDLLSRLAQEGRVDVQAALAEFSRATQSDDPDRFLEYLHDRRIISDTLFCDLHEDGAISVAKLVGVKQRTLLLEAPKKTMILPANQKTIIAEGTDPAARPTLIAAAENGNAPPDLEPMSGRSRYSLLGCLGKGAMGEVHVARDEDLLRKVAYKRMVPEVAQSRALAARFFSEIQVTAQLDHPNIVPIYGLEVTSDNALGYSMKLVQGQTLAHLVEEARKGRGDGTLGERLEIFLKVCDAMAYAHAKGVLHRDLKPENIMVGRYNEVYVMDWGICRLIGSDDPEADHVEGMAAGSAPNQRTQYGAILGTPAYMSPEQANGLNPELDARSDVYALGVILHEVVSLRGAVTGDRIEAVLARAQAGSRDPLVHHDPKVRIAGELAAIVARATAKRREDRYATASALADDLRRHLRGEAPLARPDDAFRRVARWVGRHRAAALLALLVAFAGGAAAVIGLMAHERAALGRAKEHEERLSRFVTAVAAQSHAIDSHFLHEEALLTGLAGRAAELISARPPESHTAGATVYLNEEYDVRGEGPPDLVPSTFYDHPVSFGWPVVKLPMGVSRASVADDVRLAAQLQPMMAQVFFGDGGRTPEAEQKALTHGFPLLRIFVTFDTGVHVSYPGAGGFPPDYDGRKRPKYVLSAHKVGVHWGNPYPDTRGLGLLLPMSVALYDNDGRFLGVAGADTTFGYISDRLLDLPGYDQIDDEYLVDDQGRVVVHTALHGSRAFDEVDAGADPSRAGDTHNDQPIALASLPYPAALAAIRDGHNGVVADGGRLVACYRLSALGWYYVVAADARQLMGQ